MSFKPILLPLIFIASQAFAQSYAPPAEQSGTTAIPSNSPLFVNWASNAIIERGFINIEDPSATDQGSNYASFGTNTNAVGIADNSVVSLGDAGEAILTFEQPITNKIGYDFAVFENSFSDTYLELAFVEVSSDGINYFRFPSHSETQTQTQVAGFGNLEATYLYNLAGKYREAFGTPFDLDEIDDDPLLDKNNITHVKLIDVVGSINPTYGSYDSQGNIINDPFPTPFYSSGFDLDAVGVINEKELGVNKEESLRISFYPNPAENYLNFQGNIALDELFIYDSSGIQIKHVKQIISGQQINISEIPSGMYFIKAVTASKSYLQKLLKK